MSEPRIVFTSSKEDFYLSDARSNFITLLDLRHPCHEWVNDIHGISEGFFHPSFILDKTKEVIKEVSKYNTPEITYSFTIVDEEIGEMFIQLSDGVLSHKVNLIFDKDLDDEGYDNGIQMVSLSYLGDELNSGVEGTFESIMENYRNTNRFLEFFKSESTQ